MLRYGCGCNRYDRICSLLVIGEADEIEAFLRYSVSDEEIDSEKNASTDNNRLPIGKLTKSVNSFRTGTEFFLIALYLV